MGYCLVCAYGQRAARGVRLGTMKSDAAIPLVSVAVEAVFEYTRPDGSL
jgi:hypothetical protein